MWNRAVPLTAGERVPRGLVLVVLAVMSLVLLWRRPDMAANPQFWAEDGLMFFTDARDYGVATLAWPYAGYFHLAARAGAWATAWLPAEYGPHAYAVASWLVLALVVAYVFSDRLSLRVSERVVLSLALVCTTSSNEVFFNLANWATLMAPWLILLSVSREPDGRMQAWFDIGMLVAAGLSTPYAICLWTLFALRFAHRRSRHDRVLLGVSLAVALVQLGGMGSRIASPQAGALLERVDVLGYRLGFVFFGDAMNGLYLGDTGRMLLLAGFGLVYALTAWRAWVTGAQATLFFLVAHALVMAVSFVVMRTWADADFIAHTGRHQYLPAVTLVWAFACLRMPPVQWLPVGLAFAAFVFLNPSNKLEVLPDLQWRAQVRQCRSQPGPCRIPINPITPRTDWAVTLRMR